MVRMDVCQNYHLDVLHFISRISNIDLKLRSTASVNKSQITWLLLYKDKAQFLHQESDDLTRQFRSKKNVVILLYGLASATIAIELGLILVSTDALFESINRTIGGAGLLGMSPVYPASISSLMNRINSFYIIFSIASFIMTWVATAVLLRHYSVKLGKVRYWTVVSLLLLYFLFQFVAFILNANVLFHSGNSIFYSILITLIFTLSKPVGGILFGVAFWTMAKYMSANKVVREYLIIAGFGLIMLFILLRRWLYPRNV
jgi:hypothetical protein